MFFNRFDIVIAHYVFCALWHGGQSDPLYARLCRISRIFNPGGRPLCLDVPGNENAKEIYLNLCAKHNRVHEGEIQV